MGPVQAIPDKLIIFFWKMPITPDEAPDITPDPTAGEAGGPRWPTSCCCKRLVDAQETPGWLPLYFGSIGLCYILLFTCMFLLHWRKVIRREQQAKAWVELVKSETFFPNPVVHWANKSVNYGIKAEVYAPESSASTKQAGKNSARDDADGVFVSSQVEADPCKLVFQELPFVRSLSSLPPMVSHSISYPFPALPSRAVPFTSLPDLDKVEESWHFGSSSTSEV